MALSQQEYSSGLPFPSPGDLPDSGLEPRSPVLQADSLPSEPPGTSGWCHSFHENLSFHTSHSHISVGLYLTGKFSLPCISIMKSMLVNRASLVAQMVKHFPVIQETQVQPLAWEDTWRREWQPTPVLLPGEFHGERSLVGYSPWDLKESDTTELLSMHAP